MQIQERRFQKFIFRTVYRKFIVSNVNTFIVGKIMTDMLRELDLSLEASQIVLERFVATLSSLLGQTGNLVDKHSDKNFKEIHFLHVKICRLKIFA